MKRISRFLTKGGIKLFNIIAIIISLAVFYIISSLIISSIFGTPFDVDNKKDTTEIKECYDTIIFDESPIDNNYLVVGQFPADREGVMFHPIQQGVLATDIEAKDESIVANDGVNHYSFEYSNVCNKPELVVISNNT